MDVAVPAFDVKRAVVTGRWSAEDVNIPPLLAQRAGGTFRIADGLARFDETVLEQEQGRAKASAEFRLDAPEILFVELIAEQWPVRFAGRPVSMSAGGHAKLRVNVVDRIATGEAEVSAGVSWAQRDFARIGMTASMQDKVLDIREFRAETLGGVVEGRARIPLNHWTTGMASLRWQGIQPKQLQSWAPQAERFEGTVSGTLGIGEVEPRARPPEPLRFVLNVDIENGRFGPARLGSCRIIGFVGERRLLIDEASLQVLDGQVKARSRVSTHADMYFGSLAVDFNDLNLDQLVHVADPNAGPYAGNLSGDATILASSNWHSFGGQARISLTQSDLAANGVIQRSTTR